MTASELYQIWTRRFEQAVLEAPMGHPRRRFGELGDAIGQALRLKASDIRLEIRPPRAAVWFRIAGDMVSTENPVLWPASAKEGLAELFKASKERSPGGAEGSKFDVSDYCVCSVAFEHQSFQVALRIQISPVYPSGFDAVIRVVPFFDAERFGAILEAEELAESLGECGVEKPRRASL